ncbi:MAG: hypothetical protein E7279_05120 [Lachnospiraceae bacterium]|nr:hypothetical protein [Lachnospiraceae bacterium]
MIFTKETQHLLKLYNNSDFNLEPNDILEIPTFSHNNCRITVTFQPTDYESLLGIMAVKIRTSENVIFTPFYLKEEDNEVKFIPFFDKPEYRAIKKDIVLKDNNKMDSLFGDISKHILNCNMSDVVHNDTHTWERYSNERTVLPSKTNDNVLPMTIKSVRIGEQSKKRIYRMFPNDEARIIINALWRNNKTIVFTSNPSLKRNIYAIFNDNNIKIEN